MRKLAFVLQVILLLAALPVLTILEVNHATAKPVKRKALEYTLVNDGEKETCVTLSAMPLF